MPSNWNNFIATLPQRQTVDKTYREIQLESKTDSARNSSNEISGSKLLIK